MKNDPFGHIATAKFYRRHSTQANLKNWDVKIAMMEQWDVDYRKSFYE